MPKKQIDCVVDAAHFNPNGSVKWVRAYQRRGRTYSDHLLLDRQSLIDCIKSGKSVYTGQRVPLLASTFELGKPVKLARNNDSEILTTGDMLPLHDQLEEVPVI